MTCIVAVVDGNCVVMGSDSASVAGENLQVRAGVSKSWLCKLGKDELLIGFAGNFGEGLFIRHAFQWPKRSRGQTLEAWLVADVQPALQKALRERFDDRKDEPLEWVLLVAAKPGRIFTLSQCGDVQESKTKFAAIGAGFSTALGCLEALEQQQSDMVSWDKVDLALKVAEKFHSSVRAPIHLLALA
jgi:ATP-dependent protease HslVU (ClpYQ) peptidase subunit